MVGLQSGKHEAIPGHTNSAYLERLTLPSAYGMISDTAKRHTGVGQAGLTILKSLTGPQNLELHDTRISDAGLEELRKAMPKATIHR